MCEKQEHPWNGPGTSHSTAKWVASLLSVAVGCAVVYLGGHAALSRGASNLWNRAKVAVAPRASGPLSLTTASSASNLAVIVWTVVDVLFRIAPVTHPDGPFPSSMHDLVLRPTAWWLMAIATVAVTGLVAVFTVKDRKALRPQLARSGQLGNVLPTSSSSSTVSIDDDGVSTSAGAWLALGAGRLVTSALLLPVAFLLFAPWVCTHRITFASPPSDAYVTNDCGAGGECFTFWHLVILTVAASGLVTLLAVYRKVVVPSSLSAFFGMPAFLLLTVPTRVVLAWAATVLSYFSVSWSLGFVLVCNVILSIAAVLFVRTSSSARINTPALAVFLIGQAAAVFVSCAGVFTLSSDDAYMAGAVVVSLMVSVAVVVIAYLLIRASSKAYPNASKIAPQPANSNTIRVRQGTVSAFSNNDANDDDDEDDEDDDRNDVETAAAAAAPVAFSAVDDAYLNQAPEVPVLDRSVKDDLKRGPSVAAASVARSSPMEEVDDEFLRVASLTGRSKPAARSVPLTNTTAAPASSGPKPWLQQALPALVAPAAAPAPVSPPSSPAADAVEDAMAALNLDQSITADDMLRDAAASDNEADDLVAAMMQELASDGI